MEWDCQRLCGHSNPTQSVRCQWQPRFFRSARKLLESDRARFRLLLRPRTHSDQTQQYPWRRVPLLFSEAFEGRYIQVSVLTAKQEPVELPRTAVPMRLVCVRLRLLLLPGR